MLLYYITDRTQFPGSAAEQRRALLARIVEAARAGVDYIQLREKDLPVRELEALAHEAVAATRGTRSKLLINSRADVALAAGADGVHLPAGDLAASEVRALVEGAGPPTTGNFLIAVSCHSAAEVAAADGHGADFVVFGPVFEKSGKAGVSVKALAEACKRVGPVPRTEGGHRGSLPVLALGGVTLENAADCLRSGAEGVAGIRLFQQGDVANTLARLRSLG